MIFFSNNRCVSGWSEHLNPPLLFLAYPNSDKTEVGRLPRTLTSLYTFISQGSLVMWLAAGWMDKEVNCGNAPHPHLPHPCRAAHLPSSLQGCRGWVSPIQKDGLDAISVLNPC